MPWPFAEEQCLGSSQTKVVHQNLQVAWSGPRIQLPRSFNDGLTYVASSSKRASLILFIHSLIHSSIRLPIHPSIFPFSYVSSRIMMDSGRAKAENQGGVLGGASPNGGCTSLGGIPLSPQTLGPGTQVPTASPFPR